ncbi:DnaT-like ssDNA-binding domain-containing protein [Pantoea sp. ME81]|uniref:DnaT-like ssDNA-binding domain-containing protein n=1 Tax=Pantoea sp. ME81 TaxID=2743935 RepID=UPI0015F58689|nr:DnaT-like ssDNA-binding domain-containing protein [Pantoea sp. ME81]
MSSLSFNMFTSLKTHPKINQLAALLEHPQDGAPGLDVVVGGHHSAMMTRNISRSVAIASLLVIWNVAKEFAQNGVFENVELTYLDVLADYPGFGQAMVAVGWAEYDKKKRRITLCGQNDIKQVGEVKKSPSPGARRQKEYRERLKMKNCLTGGITADYVARCNSIIQPRERAVVIPRLVHEDNGVTHFGSIVIEGVAYEVTSTPKSHRQSVTQNAVNVTKAITQSVTLADSNVTQSITDPVTQSVTVDDSGITKDATDHAVGTGCDVPRILADSALARVSGVTSPVTPEEKSVTQDITDSVTVSDFSVTPGVTFGGLDVTRDTSGVTDLEILSRVIPSRARTRFSFLRSKTLRSKHKTTHTACEENFRPADNFQPESARCQTRQIWRGAAANDPQRKRAGYKNHRLSGRRFSAMLNVTQSLTLLRQGSESVCLTRKQANPDRPQQPVRSRTIQDIFPMFPAWKPSADFLETVGKLDIALAAEPDDAELREFIGYWSAGHAQHTQQQWELKLGRCLAEGRRRGRKRYEAKRDITIMPSADYEIPEGFRGG